MSRVPVRFLSLIPALALVVLSACGDDDPQPPEWRVGTMIDWVDKGVLAEAEAPFGPLYIIKVEGTHYEMGYQYGYLMADRIIGLWQEVMIPYIGDEMDMDPEIATNILTMFLDDGWVHMESETPQIYLDELQGIYDGATVAGHEDPQMVQNVVRWALMLGDVAGAIGETSEMRDFFETGYTLAFREYFGLEEAALDLQGSERRSAMDGRFVPAIFQEQLSRAVVPMACSFFAAWGDRTADGGMIATRNMDWSADIGLQDYAAVTVWVPDGGAAHVTVAWVGFIGGLAGMSERGIAKSSVEATSVHMRIHSEPMLLRVREVLEHTSNLDDAMPYFTNEVPDGLNRPVTIGANALIAFGDPDNGGAGAEAVAIEVSGIFAAIFRRGTAPDCTEEAYLYEFGLEGSVVNEWNSTDHPDIAPIEAESYEVDASGLVRTFEVDGDGEFVYDATGLLIPDPNGEPYRLGYPLPCAIYRAATALARGVRRWQTADNGPQRDRENKLAHLSGSYRTRYYPHYPMLDAYYNGVSFEWEGQEVIPDNGGVKVPIGVEEAKVINQVVGMENSHVFAVIYDLKNMVLYVSFESGTGESWVKAGDNEYLELRFSDLILRPAGGM